MSVSVSKTDRHYLLELGVFGLGFLEGEEVRVSVFPCGEEVLIGGAGFGGVVLQGVGASEAELQKASASSLTLRVTVACSTIALGDLAQSPDRITSSIVVS